MSQTDEGTARTAVSIVCVFNELDVLDSTLARSVEAGRGKAPLTELITVDSRGGDFATAGAALNHGAAQATNEVVVFVHQDVYLHSLVELERAAYELLSTPKIGVMGAVGIGFDGRIHGRIRDRVIGLGRSAQRPYDVESMDEVLFLVAREQLRTEPLADDLHLGWHAYAVEYSARMRSSGRRAVVRDIPLTHNSLSTNLQRLDVAHQWVAEAHPALLPLRTTCGTIRASTRSAIPRWRQRIGGAARWARESREGARAHRVVPMRDVVLADVRFAIDEVISRSGATSIRALEVSPLGGERTRLDGLTRFGASFSAASIDIASLPVEILHRLDGELLVLAGLDASQLESLDLTGSPVVVGYSQEAGLWAIVGVTRDELAPLWTQRRSHVYGGLLRKAPARTAPIGALA